MKVTPFEKLHPADQRWIVSELLLEYSKWDEYKRETQMYTVALDNGARYGMPFQLVGKMAASFIMEDNMKARKFEMFIKKLQEKAIENVYEFLMGEAIERALK